MPFPSLLYYYYLPCAADPAPPADTANNTYVDNSCSNAVLCRICRRPSREIGCSRCNGASPFVWSGGGGGMRGCGKHDVENTRGIWQELVVWLVSAVIDLGRRQKVREGGGYIYTVLGHKSCGTFPKSPPH
jgi:hypothetical protein